MAWELMYTSAPQGLKPGSRGFCTVAMTRGLGVNLVQRLESMSGYRPYFPSHAPEASSNPINFAYCHFPLGAQEYFVLSRLCYAGVDYTQRSNKFVHHVVLTDKELPPEGPAWLALQDGFFESAWSGDPRLLPDGRRIPCPPRPGLACAAWQKATGDAGWAGVLAERFLQDEAVPVAILFQPGMAMLPLIDEALALLPPDKRWDVAFSTYLTDTPGGITYLWRCLLLDSPLLGTMKKNRELKVLDLTGEVPRATGGRLVDCARSGEDPWPEPQAEPVADQATGPIVPEVRVPSGRPPVKPEAPIHVPPRPAKPLILFSRRPWEATPRVAGRAEAPPPEAIPEHVLRLYKKRKHRRRLALSVAAAIGLLLLVSGTYLASSRVTRGRSTAASVSVERGTATTSTTTLTPTTQPETPTTQPKEEPKDATEAKAANSPSPADAHHDTGETGEGGAPIAPGTQGKGPALDQSPDGQSGATSASKTGASPGDSAGSGQPDGPGCPKIRLRLEKDSESLEEFSGPVSDIGLDEKCAKYSLRAKRTEKGGEVEYQIEDKNSDFEQLLIKLSLVDGGKRVRVVQEVRQGSLLARWTRECPLAIRLFSGKVLIGCLVLCSESDRGALDEEIKQLNSKYESATQELNRAQKEETRADENRLKGFENLDKRKLNGYATKIEESIRKLRGSRKWTEVFGDQPEKKTAPEPFGSETDSVWAEFRTNVVQDMISNDRADLVEVVRKRLIGLLDDASRRMVCAQRSQQACKGPEERKKELEQRLQSRKDRLEALTKKEGVSPE